MSESRHDKVTQEELKELEIALSTASGALYLIQLALIGRYSETGQTSKRISFPAARSHSEYDIVADYDPEPTDDAQVWHPTFISASRNIPGSYILTRNGRLTHRRTHLFIDTPFTDIPEGIKYEEDDFLIDGDHEVEIDTFEQELSPDENLPEDLLKLVKEILKAVVESPQVEAS